MKNILKIINLKLFIGIMMCVCILFMNCELPVYASECEVGGQHEDLDKDCACDKCGAAMHVYETKTYVPTSTSGAVASGDSSNTSFYAENKSDVSRAVITLKQWGNVNANDSVYGYNLDFPQEGDYVVYTSVYADGNAKTSIVLDSSVNITNGQMVHFTKGYHCIMVSIDVTSFTKGGKASVSVAISAMQQKACVNCNAIGGEGGEEEPPTEEAGEHVDINMDCICDNCGELLHEFATETYVPTSISGGVMEGDSSNTKFSAENTYRRTQATITLNQWGNFTDDNTKYSHCIDVPKEGDYKITARPSSTTGTYALTDVILDNSIVLAKNVAKTQTVHLTPGKHWITSSINVTQFRKGGAARVIVSIDAITETRCIHCGAFAE